MAKVKARWDAFVMALRGRLLYVTVWLILGAWKFLPAPLANFLAAHVIGNLLYWAWPRWRSNARQAMARVQGPQADQRTVERLARRSVRHYCLYASDFVRFRTAGLKKRLSIDGWDNLEEALGEGKGAILIGLHLGNWDLAAAALALRNYPVNVIVERFESAVLDRTVQNNRRRLGIKTIPRDKGPIPIVQALRRNEMLAILIDQSYAGSHVTVNFFDAPIQVPAGAARLALRSGARIVTGGLVRLPDNRFLGFIDKQLPFQPTGDMERDAQALTQLVVASLEKWVRRYPDQWYPFRQLWAPTVA